MKKILCALCLAALLLSLFGCRGKYRGKDINYIEYSTVDYSGGMKTYKKLELDTGRILLKYESPSSLNSAEYRVIGSFDVALKGDILSAFYSEGLFDLDDSYTTSDTVLDGGSWSLLINYSDGAQKVSSGSNAGPHIFDECDIAFFDLTGEEFFGFVPLSYKTPPALQLTIEYDSGSGLVSNGIGGIASKSYLWRGKEYKDREWFIGTSIDSLGGNHNYRATASIIKDARDNERIKNAIIYVSETEPRGTEELECSFDKDSIEFKIEPNLNYTLVVEYKNGTAEYYFNTHILTND